MNYQPTNLRREIKLRKLFVALIAMVALSFAAVALARTGATKQKQKAFMSVVASSDTAAPLPVSVPSMTGYDVILNLSEPRVSVRADSVHAVTTAKRGLSPTVDWRGRFSAGSLPGNSSTMLVSRE